MNSTSGRTVGRIGVVAVGLLAATLLMALFLLTRPNESVPATLDPSAYESPFTFTATTRFTPTNEAELAVITSTVYYSDSTHYMAVHSNGKTWREGNLTVEEDMYGQLDLEDNEVPFPAPLGLAINTSPDVLCFRSNAATFVDRDLVARMLAAQQISVTNASSLFGRPVVLAEKDNSVHGNQLLTFDRCKLWYDADSGFLFRAETSSGTDEPEEYSVEDLDFNQSIAPAVLHFAGDLSQMKSATETRVFDPNLSYEYPPETDLAVVPTATEFDYGIVAGPLIFISETKRVPGTVLSDPGSYWAIVQQLTSPDGREIAVIQASTQASAYSSPISNVAGPYWPQEEIWGNDWPPHQISSTDVALPGGATGTLYTLDDSQASGRYLVTWELSPELRILFVGNGQLGSGQELVDVINDYISVVPAATSAPTTTPTPAAFDPVADTYTLSTQPTQNYGTQSVLDIRGGSSPYYRSYLKFDVSGLSGAVTLATLRLWVSDTSVDYGQPGSVSNSWTETGLNWNNQPSMPMNFLTVAGPENGYVTIDVTTEITGNGTYSFGIQSLSSDLAAFGSREDSNPDHRPLLAITTQ